MTSPAPSDPAAAPRPTPCEIALRPAEMHLYKPTGPAVATVTRTEICTAPKAAGFVRHLELDVSGTNLVGKCLPGQSIGVLAPGLDATGKPHKLRLYSVANPTAGEDGAGRVISTTVKRAIDEHWDNHKLFLGVASNYLCDLQVGDKVNITGPSGKKFVLPQTPGQHDYIFIATGTGIAPFRGMILDLLTSAAPSRIVLIMGSPYRSDLLYDKQFRELAAKHPNFTYLTAISRERNSGPSGPAQHDRMYVQDRFTADRDQLEPLLRSSRTLIYVCGIAGMELGILQQLATMLRGDDLNQWLAADSAAMSDIKAWNRSMLHKQIMLSRRIFLEVYA